MKYFRLTILLLATVWSMTSASSLPGLVHQGGPEENVLRPAISRIFAGPILGAGYNLHIGKFITQCDCEYSGGTGFGSVGGLYVEYPLSADWSLYGGALYQDLRADFTVNETRLEYAQDGQFVNVQFERNAEVLISYIGLSANAKWRTGVQGLYLGGGISGGFLQSNHHLTETEKILTPGFVYSSNRTNQNTFIDGGLPDKQSLRLAAQFAAGYDFHLSPAFAVSPELSFQFPFTGVSTAYGTWRATSLALSVFVKFGF